MNILQNNAQIQGEKLIVSPYEIWTSQKIAEFTIKGAGISFSASYTTDAIGGGDMTFTIATIYPNTIFVATDGATEQILYWDGRNIIEKGTAWFGGGEDCFTAAWEGNAILRKKWENVVKSVTESSTLKKIRVGKKNFASPKEIMLYAIEHKKYIGVEPMICSSPFGRYFVPLSGGGWGNLTVNPDAVWSSGHLSDGKYHFFDTRKDLLEWCGDTANPE